jgi:hypothetical protein
VVVGNGHEIARSSGKVSPLKGQAGIWLPQVMASPPAT